MSASPASRDSHPSQEPGESKPRFVWPPNKRGPATPPPQDSGDSTTDGSLSPSTSVTAPAKPLHWWSQVEEAWLGRITPPFRELAQREGWKPDPLSAACPRCAQSVGLFEAVQFEGEEFGCPACRGEKLPWTRAVRLGPHTGLLRDAILDTKFTGFRRTGETLGELLAEQLRPVMAEAGIEAGDMRLVPVPMSLRRRLSRGIHHTLALARGMRRVLGIPILESLARRHGPSQLEVPPSERGKNVRGSMTLRRPPPEGVRVVVLVDDVMTTGATMREACRALAAGWSVGSGAGQRSPRKVAEESGSIAQSERQVWVAACGVAGEAGGGS